MEEQQQTDVGTVVEVNGNRVRVEVKRSGGCNHCAMRGLCFGNNTPAVFDLRSDLELTVGDTVELDIAPGSRVFSALVVFGIPMLMMFAGFIVAQLWLTELGAIGVAFAATAIGFLLIRLIDRKTGDKLQVRIGRRL
jgi:positive regulator of sigma E activity